MSARLESPDRPAPLAALPFRLVTGRGLPYLEGVPTHVGALVVTFFAGTAEFLAVTRMMEMYRELERRMRTLQKEKEDALAALVERDGEIFRKDKALAEYERQLGQFKRRRGAEA